MKTYLLKVEITFTKPWMEQKFYRLACDSKSSHTNTRKLTFTPFLFHVQDGIESAVTLPEN